jgi:hypothetical protein
MRAEMIAVRDKIISCEKKTLAHNISQLATNKRGMICLILVYGEDLIILFSVV